MKPKMKTYEVIETLSGEVVDKYEAENFEHAVQKSKTIHNHAVFVETDTGFKLHNNQKFIVQEYRPRKYEHYQVGDTIKVYDNEPMEWIAENGRYMPRYDFIVGRIEKKTVINREKVFLVRVMYDNTFEFCSHFSRIGTIVTVPMQVEDEFEGRIVSVVNNCPAYDILYTFAGGATVASNRADRDEEIRDYRKIAFIYENGTIKFFDDDNTPEYVKEQIRKWAKSYVWNKKTEN